MEITKALEILTAVVFFGNKAFMLAGRRVGWLLGTLGAALAVAYFIRIDLYVLTALEIGIVILMGCRYAHEGRFTPRMEIFLRVVIGAVLFAIAIFVFSGWMTVVEFITSVIFLAGTYYLVTKRERAGWALYVVCHLITWWLMVAKGQPFFADFQLASAIVSLAGALKKE